MRILLCLFAAAAVFSARAEKSVCSSYLEHEFVQWKASDDLLRDIHDAHEEGLQAWFLLPQGKRMEVQNIWKPRLRAVGVSIRRSEILQSGLYLKVYGRPQALAQALILNSEIVRANSARTESLFDD